MRTANNSEEQPMNRAKIMVVDDDPDLRHALSSVSYTHLDVYKRQCQ